MPMHAGWIYLCGQATYAFIVPHHIDSIAHPLQEIASDRYFIMYYKQNSLIVVRRKFDYKNTAFSFGGKTCGRSEEELRKLADDCLTKLKAGETEPNVKEWVDAKVAE